MSTHHPPIDYYNRNAEAFRKRTAVCTVAHLCDAFFSLLPTGGAYSRRRLRTGAECGGFFETWLYGDGDRPFRIDAPYGQINPQHWVYAIAIKSV